MSSHQRCVMFDLDGTLADTLKDIARSVNMTRQDYQLPVLPLETIMSYIGDGARKLLERSIQDHQIDLDEGLLRMVDHYYTYPVVDTTLYPGVFDGLKQLKDDGNKLAVITNKPGKVARAILEILKIDDCFEEVIGGGDGFPLKPDPTPAAFILRKCDANPDDSWMLGDNHTDLDLAINAKMRGAFAEWGFGQAGQASYEARFADFQSFVRYLLDH